MIMLNRSLYYSAGRSKKKLNSGSGVEQEGAKIESFLHKQEAPISEPLLIEQLFGIHIPDENIPKSDDLRRLIMIRETLKDLVKQKKIFVANLEDPETKEQVPHYSSKGWFATP